MYHIPSIYEAEKIINKIVWWIPSRDVRNLTRGLLQKIYNNDGDVRIYDNEFIDFGIHIRKDFCNDKNFINRYKKLISGLDVESVNLVNKIMSKISNFNNIDDDINLSRNDFDNFKAALRENSEKIIKVNDECYIYDGKYILNQCLFTLSNYYDKIGIPNIKNIDRIKNKSIIDAGAYIGDTAIILSDYTDDKVYAFEPFLKTFNSLKKNIELNKEFNNKNNIVPVNMALGDENKDMFISNKSIDGTNSIYDEGGINSDDKLKISMTTLDKFVEDNNLEVGLIKTDLEGFEQPFLRGALNTIKKQRPTLLISIYHSYTDFFDIKPMIEDLNLGYKFKILDTHEHCFILETKLLAEIE